MCNNTEANKEEISNVTLTYNGYMTNCYKSKDIIFHKLNIFEFMENISCVLCNIDGKKGLYYSNYELHHDIDVLTLNASSYNFPQRTNCFLLDYNSEFELKRSNIEKNSWIGYDNIELNEKQN